jgi:transitional endoplasmic reticulum ATPase
MTEPAPRIIGFDLGHAETALAVVKDAQSTGLGLLDLPSGKRRPVMATVVAECTDGVLRIGYPAIDTNKAETRYAGFKSPELNRPSVRHPVLLFVSALRDEVRAEGHLAADRSTRWVFGAPSGWDNLTVEAFRALLTELELGDVEVIRESRAAMLYARDSGDFSFDESDLYRSVLVIDLGSSTTDFTIVEGLAEKPNDARAGHRLGASLIDRAVLDWTLKHHPKAEELLGWLQQSPQTEWARLELTCRWAKEDYFRNEAAARDGDPVSGGWLYRPIEGDSAAMFEVLITRETMTELLRQPIVDGNSWPEQFRQDLRAAIPADFRPDLVLMTGGASRMPFTQAIVREQFGDERVVVGSEPELAIARGLAIAGRIGYRAAGLRHDVDELLASGLIQPLVARRLPELADGIGTAVADRFYERFVLPSFARFKSGAIATLADLEREIGAKVAAELTDSNPRIVGVAVAWQNRISEELAQLTEPICDRWRVPHAVLSLPAVSVRGNSVGSAVPVSKHLTGVAGGVAGAIAGIVTYVVSVVLILLFAAGPVTEMIGAVMGLIAIGVAVAYGREAAMDRMKDMKLPRFARRMLNEGKLRRKAPKHEAQLQKDVSKAIKDRGEELVVDVARRLGEQLRAQATEVELLILPGEVKKEKRPDKERAVMSGKVRTAGPGDAGGRDLLDSERRAAKDAGSGGGGGSAADTSQRRAATDGQQREAAGKFRLQPPGELPNFAQVGGMDELKAELSDTVGLRLAFGEEAEAFRITFNGVLLHGPTGTGKTFLAKATAGEFGLNFMQVGVAELMSKFAGESAQNVAQAFAYAAASTPCLLLFDEFDSIAARRDEEPNQENRRVVNQLLTSLEQYRPLRDLVVMATTNDIDRLDAAAVRPGRFDRRVRVDLPDLPARTAILGVQLADRPTDSGLDAEVVARRADGMTAAALAAIVDDAANAAFRETIAQGAKAPITTAHLLGALTARGGKDRPTVEQWSWDSLVVDDATKVELRQLQSLLEDPERAAAFGIEPPGGLLLAGPPGTGKTTVARVLASESHCSFYPITAHDLTSKWVGESEAKVAQLFTRARDNAPSIVFIDEIDAIGAARGVLGAGWADRLLNQLLAEIDGLGSRGKVMVIGATNRPDILDPALTRGGRLSRTIWIGLPDTPARKRMLELYSARMPLDRVDLDRLAELTEALSGADIPALCQQAATAAMTRIESASAGSAEPHVTMTDFEAALTTLRQARERLTAGRTDASMAQFLDALSGAPDNPRITER